MAASTVRPVDAAHQLPAVCRLLATHGADALPAVLGLLGRAIGAPVSFRAGAGPAVGGPGTVPAPRRASTGVELAVAIRERVFGALVVQGPLPTGPSERADAAVRVDDADPSGGQLELLTATADVLALVLAAPSVRSGSAAAAALLRLEEEERSELADQLHDTLVQSLIAARYLADLAARDAHPAASPRAEARAHRQGDGPLNARSAAEAAAVEVREAVQAALRDGRHVLARLRPRALDGLGVLAAMRSLLPDGDADRVVIGRSVPAQLPDVVGVAAFRFVQAAVTDLLARGLEPGLLHVAVVGGNLDLWVRGEPARSPAVEYPWAARCPEEPDSSCANAITRWTHRLRLLGGGGVLDDLSAHAWLPLSDGSSTAGPALDAGRKT